MEMLKLALESRLPFIRVISDDLVYLQRVLNHIAGLPQDPDSETGVKEATGIILPQDITDINTFKLPKGPTVSHVFYTSSECRSLTTLYNFALLNEITIVFVNVDPNSVYFDAGTMIPPKDLVVSFLQEMEAEGAEELVQAFGGMSLKDVSEVARMTMTRDEKLSVRGINETRQGYKALTGITQVDTGEGFYVCPDQLTDWMKNNKTFFMEPLHPSLTPRGLLFDGPPGTGKTLSAKFIAREFGVPLYRLDLGAMMGKYVGTSENNLNAALAQIDEVQPCVVILDEVEKVFRSQGGDSGVSSRMLSQLLWWLQEHKSKVFTVMTTNDVTAIPAELYREGRIDATMQFLGLPNYSAGLPFAKGAMVKLLEDMAVTLPDSAEKALEISIKQLFMEGQAVPQTKVAQAVQTLVREALTAQHHGEELEVAPNPLIMSEAGSKPVTKSLKAGSKVKPVATLTAP